MTPRILTIAALCLAVLLPSAAEAGTKGPWEEIRNEEGIKVWRRVTEGSNVVEFKGTALVKTSLVKAITVISVSERLCEWRDRCAKSYQLEKLTGDRQVVYYRLDSPPLIEDRDVIVEATCEPGEKGAVMCPFKSRRHKKDPKPDGVIRMPKLKGFWRLVPKSAGRVEITYKVAADPGGWIPMWIYNLASKKLPFKALQGLRKQVKVDYGADEARVQARLNEKQDRLSPPPPTLRSAP